MRKGLTGAITLGLAMIIGLGVVGSCVEIVPAGYCGIVYSAASGISGEVLDQGWHVVAPTKKVTEYSVGIEQSYLTTDDMGDSPNDESFNTPTSDGKTLKVDLEFSYMYDREKLPQTFTQFKGQSGKQVKDSFIKPKVKAWTQEVTAKYPVTDVFGDKRQELNEELDVYLREKFAPYGIIIDTVNFTNISTDAETQAAIQKKVNAQQELELANIEAQTAKVQAEKDKQVALITAEKEKEAAAIDAEKKKIQAEANATAVRIAAEAEAEANQKIAESLTPELVEKIKLEQWNGQLPSVQGNATPIISLN